VHLIVKEDCVNGCFFDINVMQSGIQGALLRHVKARVLHACVRQIASAALLVRESRAEPEADRVSGLSRHANKAMPFPQRRLTVWKRSAQGAEVEVR
jgi:DNA-binding NarL/FixJ family response regulator